MALHRWQTAALGFPLLLSAIIPSGAAASTPPPVQVILDGKTLRLDPPPAIVGDRALVPLRGVFEAMGAEVLWHGSDRSVEARRGDRYVRLKLDRRLACLNQSCHSATVLDVPAQVMQERTFVPIRFVSQALGARVTWDAARRAVLVQTDQLPEVTPSPVRVITVAPGAIISEPVDLRTEGQEGGAIQFYLINPATGAGNMAAAGSDPKAAYRFVPDPVESGPRLLVAAIRSAGGAWVYSDPVPVTLAPNPRVAVTGVVEGGLITGPVTLSSEVNFTAAQVTFRMTDLATGSVENLGTVGPGDTVTWYPQVAHAGEKRFQAVAADRNGKTYESDPVAVQVRPGYRQFLSGITNGATISRPVTLRVSLNYPTDSIQYLLNGKHFAWGYQHTWNFGPEANGAYTLEVLVTGPDGNLRSPDPITFTIKTSPQVWFSGLGPNQVVTGPVTLRSHSNVPVRYVVYHLVDEQSNIVELLGTASRNGEFTWTPQSRHAGNRILRAVGIDEAGQPVYSDRVSFRVYLGKTYGPQPIVARSEFLGLSSRLSVQAYRETGMSAALKVAQSILETGWGQSSPVDKYTGQVSYNLFGIKGKGPAGSVISNTWEEYNGVAYRVDDYFRAYNSIQESWNDHADLLLTRSWYAPYRAVMTNPVLGAWALRRSGYATDSQYPVKLINIMKQYDLFKLDEFEL